MNEHDMDREIEHQVLRLLNRLEVLVDLAIERLRRVSPPAAPILAGTFTPLGDSMNAVLVATIPTTRQDGSALAATDIASITFQKTSLTTDTPPVAGPEVVLATNAAAAGAGLTPDQITFTDTSATPGDSYTCFITDTAGDVSPLSNADVDPVVAPTLSPPSAPSLAATFS
jgi:hypothetical protein